MLAFIFFDKIYFRRAEMAAIVNAESCVACGACVDACPCGAIEIQDVAVVNDTCAGCGACVDACPTGAITLE